VCATTVDSFGEGMVLGSVRGLHLSQRPITWVKVCLLVGTLTLRDAIVGYVGRSTALLLVLRVFKSLLWNTVNMMNMVC
jgi:hypothetical protein